jgi:HEPN domain-containing protein
LQSAFHEKDYNLAVRRAQEVVELALKGGLRLLNLDYPKIHEVSTTFTEQARKKNITVEQTVLQRIEQISSWLSESRTSSFYFEREYTETEAKRAREDAAFVLQQIETIFGLESYL